MVNIVDNTVTRCTRHNICEGKEKCFHPEYAQDKSALPTVYKQLDPTHMHTGPVSQQMRKIRDAICAHTLEQEAQDDICFC